MHVARGSANGEGTEFAVSSQVRVGETRLVVAGEIDLATAPRFLGALDAALDTCPEVLVLEIAGLSFIDARSAGAIAAASTRMRDWGGRLEAREAQESPRCVFALCGVSELLSGGAGDAGVTTEPPKRSSPS
jgi:stage II sporulation protein AA (anti-sigma F factor antagonist)